MVVPVRYFAAAKAVLGRSTDRFDAAEVPTIGALVARIVAGAPEAAPVLARCSFLVGGASTTDPDRAILDDENVDVLPPFAGG